MAPLHKDLRGVPRDVLEDHVLQNIRQFAVLFATELVPGITQQQLDIAFSRALYALTRPENGSQISLELRFSHNCRYLGCTSPECGLCKNNPHKTCAPTDNFDEAYADNQVLRARCEAETYVELVNAATGEVYPAPGVEVQLSVIDGDAYNEQAAEPLATIMELHTSDEGVPLLNCFGTSRAITPGTLVISLQNGRAKLPEAYITDKNDTFHFNGGATTSHFRLMGLAMRRDEMGQPVPVEGVAPVVSNSFVVKTQRALNDYRKSAYPHYRDELTRLRYIGAITATRLKDARAWLGKDVPLAVVDNVESLKKLLEYADTNRQVENKLLELLNMRGKHKHKWDFLRSVLAEKVVYDDTNIRVWYAPEGGGGGLLYYAKQAQVSLDKPAGVVQRLVRPDGSGRVQVQGLTDINQHPQLLDWRRAAEAAWKQPGHAGWQVLQEPIEWVNTWTPGQPVISPASMSMPPAAARDHSVTSSVGAMYSSSPPSEQMLMQHPAYAAAAAAVAAAAAAANASSSGMSGMQQQRQASNTSGSAVAGGGGGSSADYPAVPRQQLGGQHQVPQHLSMAADYPSIGPPQGMDGFGMGRQQQQTQQQQTQLQQQLLLLQQRHRQQQQQAQEVLDPMAMRCHSTTTTVTASEAPAPSLMDDPRQDSAFMIQHAGDSVDLALRHPSTTSDAGDGPPAATGAGGSGTSKRSRAVAQDVAVAVGPDGQRLLVPTPSRGRHQPTLKTGGDTAAAAGPRLGEFESLTADDLETLGWMCERGDHVGGRDVGREPAVPEDAELLTAGLDLTNTLKSVLHLSDEGLAALDEPAAPSGRRPTLRQCESDSFKRIIGVIGSPKNSTGFGNIEALLAGETPFGASLDAAAVTAAVLDAQRQQH